VGKKDREVPIAGKIHRRSRSPGTMFVILVVGSPVVIPAFLINSNFYYRLCLLGAGIFTLILFVLSFIYDYHDSKENKDGRFRRTVIGIVAVFLILCVLGYVAFTKSQKYMPFENYDKVQQQLRQREKFKKEHPELFNNKTDNVDP
jgi:heme/copper-type cytochrome/quinol oxidase subunit 2